jgi:hypothetical protein
MKPKDYRLWLASVLISFLLFNGRLQAQNENKQIQKKDSLSYSLQPGYFDQMQTVQNQPLNQTFSISSYFSEADSRTYGKFFRSSDSNATFSLSQFAVNSEFPGLGASRWFNNQMVWEAGTHLTLKLEAGLAIQNTVFDPFIPNYQYTLGINFEYNFNDHLTAYAFSRYVSAPVNKPKDYFDPLLYNNSLFLQSESGVGIRSTVRNTPIDFRITSGFNQQLKTTNSFNSN